MILNLSTRSVPVLKHIDLIVGLSVTYISENDKRLISRTTKSRRWNIFKYSARHTDSKYCNKNQLKNSGLNSESKDALIKKLDT